jgi:predicted transcriptional regulator
MYLLEREKHIALSPKLYTIKRKEEEHTKMKQQQWEKQIEGSKGSILLDWWRKVGSWEDRANKVQDERRWVGGGGKARGSQAKDQHPWTLVYYL